MKYRSRLGSHAALKVANGDTWEVELATNDDGLIWLVKGWEDFTKHYTLKQGDIVVFRLEQDSLFRVNGVHTRHIKHILEGQGNTIHCHFDRSFPFNL
ncbi:unnamed protein product [Linum tenue]|uniref:TF-B3 domain-containing protein n=1 Tax=Linum tenue TaxID=586396 RepID=A0AAV0L709_9ROSI|nr:unnamed protein product [Linum tenue]